MAKPEWWRSGVVYQIYPRSFADSNGDGIGDLRGITARLDHLEWLGVDAIWLSPTFPSPNADWGYDVADYCAVHPDFGTMDDLDELVAQAAAKSIRIVLDLVPNHTSVEHPWFVDARSSRTAEYRDWYVWADPKPDGAPPNNWIASFGGTAWELDENTGQSYLHNFFASQADLNWWNQDVRDEFDRILRFWFDRGVAGFRIDVAHMIVKDRELRDNPPATDDDFILDRIRGQVPEYNSNRPEVHDVHRHWRTVAESYEPSRLLVGETFVPEISQLMKYYGNGDELSLALNVPFVFAPLRAEDLRGAVEQAERLIPAGCTPVWTGSNHDVSRMPTRWAAGNASATRCALLMLFALRGSVFLYYGDELGMPDTDMPADRRKDALSIEFAPVLDRDAARTPMPWTGAPGAGFTEPGVEPWVPFGDVAACNVAAQVDDPESTMVLTRDLIALRRALPELVDGPYETMTGTDTLWAWRRGEHLAAAVNLGDGSASLDDITGTIRIATNRSRDGEQVAGTLELGPWEGTIVELG